MSRNLSQELFQRNPAIYLLLPILCGILLMHYILPASSTTLYLLISIGGGALFGSLFTFRQQKYALLYSLFFSLTCICSGSLLYFFQTSSSREIHWPQEAQVYRFTILDTPKKTASGISCVAETPAHERIRLFLYQPSPASSLLPGDRVIASCQIEPLRNAGNPGEIDYASYLRHQGIQGTAFVPTGKFRLLPPQQPSLSIRALRFRDKLIAKYRQYFAEEELAVLSALTLGDKSYLQKSMREMFSETGASHVLALSGLHLSILFGLFYNLLLRRTSHRKIKGVLTCLAIAGIWSFALLAGFPTSLVRAAIMLTIALITSFFRRDSFSINNLFLAALFIILWDVQAVFDVGFQLSFLSVLSILLLTPRLSKWEWIQKYPPLYSIYQGIITTFCAQLGTAPLVLYVFQTFPLYGILTNLIILPFVSAILLFTFPFFLLPFAQSVIATIIHYLLHALLGILQRIAALPFASIEYAPRITTVLLLYLAILFFASWVFRRRWYKINVLLLCLIGSYCLEFFSPSPWHHRILFYSLRHSTSIQFISHPSKTFLLSICDNKGKEELEQTLRRFSLKEHIAPPSPIRPLSLQFPVYWNPPLLSFEGKRIAIADSTLTFHDSSQKISVDVLLVQKGFRGGIKKLESRFAPHLLIIDSRLSPQYAQYLTREARLRHWDVHSLRTDGAYILPSNSAH